MATTAHQHRYPTPDEMAILDALLDPHSQAKVRDPGWRKARQMACRMKYEERTGLEHPAWAGTDEMDPLTHDGFVALYAPPPGMLWAEFGRKWDLAPVADEQGMYEVILRHADMQGQWRGRVFASAEPLHVE